eukprot:m51a1_g3972 hypothetical protein (408) ;mRNA; r:423907-425301
MAGTSIAFLDDKEVERQLLESFARRHGGLRARTDVADLTQSTSSHGGGSASSSQQAPLRLELRQKYYVALKETEALAEDLEKLKAEKERVTEQARADAEEAELRIADLKREAWEFRRDILAASTAAASSGGLAASSTFSLSLGGDVAPPTMADAPPRAEAVREYFERKLAARAAQVDKLRLKNASLAAQAQRLEKDVSARQDEQSEGFSPIDFQQLKIENQQYQERIDARNQELLRLKLQAATTGQSLNRCRKHLEGQVRENERLKARISQQKAVLGQLASESTTVADDRDRAMRVNQKLRTQQEEYKVPEVLEYITLKAELHEVLKRVSEWERKVEIAQMAARKQSRSATAQSSGLTSSVPPSAGAVAAPSSQAQQADILGLELTSTSPGAGAAAPQETQAQASSS